MAVRYLVVITCLALMAAGTYVVLDAVDDHVVPWTLPAAVVAAVLIATGYVVLRRRKPKLAAPDGSEEE